MSVRADAESLRMIPIFRDCDPVALQVMAFAAERQNFLQGEFLAQEGKLARSAYFIMSGTVGILTGSTEINLASPGAMIGETAMIGGTPYSVSAIAKESVSTTRIDQGLFQRMISEYPEFGRAVAHALSRRLEESVRELDGVRQMFTRSKRFADL